MDLIRGWTSDPCGCLCARFLFLQANTLQRNSHACVPYSLACECAQRRKSSKDHPYKPRTSLINSFEVPIWSACFVTIRWVAVAQVVEQVIFWPEGWWFKPCLSACQISWGKTTSPRFSLMQPSKHEYVWMLVSNLKNSIEKSPCVNVGC